MADERADGMDGESEGARRTKVEIEVRQVELKAAGMGEGGWRRGEDSGRWATQMGSESGDWRPRRRAGRGMVGAEERRARGGAD